MKYFRKSIVFILLMICFPFAFGCVGPKEPEINFDDLEEKDVYGNGYNTNLVVGFDEQGHTVKPVSAEKPDRQVGIFYFLWLGQPFASDIYDVSKIIGQYGKDVVFHEEDAVISPNQQAHYWGEPLFGYYNSADFWVIRKHMELLTDAGVDFLVFDTTNAVTYTNVAKRVMSVISELRSEGWDAPQVVFYTHSYSIQTINSLYRDLYKPEVFPDAWFRVDGKPMIIGYTDVNTDHAVSENESYWPEPLSKEITDFFYIREARWPGDKVVENGWPYTEWVYPQPMNTDMISVSIATHPMVPFSFSLTHENWCNWGRGYNVETGENVSADVMKGTFYDAEWQTVYQRDPRFVFVTGWNEWIAYKQPYGGEYMLCDNVDMEYSRDSEPMKGGYEDAYFIQTIDSIRKYKYESMDGILPETARKTIVPDGGLAQWEDVNAIYRRIGRDDGSRHTYGSSKSVRFDTDPVTNNLLSVKVTNDADNIYFLIEAEKDLLFTGEDNNLNLFLGKGMPEQKKGWEGYEYRLKVSGEQMDVIRLNSDFTGKTVGSAAFFADGNHVVISLSRELVKLNGNCEFYFKAADGVDDPAEIMDYYASGRSLPMGRLSYLYLIKD